MTGPMRRLTHKAANLTLLQYVFFYMLRTLFITSDLFLPNGSTQILLAGFKCHSATPPTSVLASLIRSWK